MKYLPTILRNAQAALAVISWDSSTAMISFFDKRLYWHEITGGEVFNSSRRCGFLTMCVGSKSTNVAQADIILVCEPPRRGRLTKSSSTFLWIKLSVPGSRNIQGRKTLLFPSDKIVEWPVSLSGSLSSLFFGNVESLWYGPRVQDLRRGVFRLIGRQFGERGCCPSTKDMNNHISSWIPTTSWLMVQISSDYSWGESSTADKFAALTENRRGRVSSTWKYVCSLLRRDRWNIFVSSAS